jgi:predicted lipoprotein with Yx(FWY)xxD motif
LKEKRCKKENPMILKRAVLCSFILCWLVLFLAACGNAGATTTGSSPATTNTPTAAPTTPAAASPVVSTASATVNGKSVTILTDAKGMTLYYFTKDTPTSSACTDSCAQNWPPLLFSGSGTPTSSATLPGTLRVVNTANGQQVAYQGHLLYTFAGDTAPGQTNGEGKFGLWFVATTDLTSAGGSSGGATPTPTLPGY